MPTALGMDPGTRTARPRWPAALAPALWALCLLGLVVTAWFDHLLRQAGRPGLAQLDAGAVTAALGALSAAVAGAVLASRRPGHPVAWLLLAFGLLPGAFTDAAEGHARYGLLVRPGGLPAPATWPCSPRSPSSPGSACSASSCC